MTSVGLLYSGGKDSTLAALLLADAYDEHSPADTTDAVTCVTGTFGITEDWQHARESARAVGLAWERVDLDRAVAEEAVDRLLDDGHPSGGIQAVHEHTLEAVATAEEFDVVADGTRRDDRAPTVDRPTARSLEDRHGVDYVAPLAGFGRSAVDDLVAGRLRVETGPSETVGRGDYEAELRELLRRDHGAEAVGEVFPAHEQSRVTGLR